MTVVNSPIEQGYTRNAVVHNGVVDKGVELISKPFSIDELAAKVRTLLDS